mmetsp:Transcript_26804/g.27247  ORF Transcript_26804/g.27247 Transcript_26804/m.27247 type:complete len:152 (+) Transcript_26804:1-456(+)
MRLTVSSSSSIAASQADVAPLLFDLTAITDYHPDLGTAEIVSEKKAGLGAKRKLTYDIDCVSYYETIIQTNEVDDITYELSEYPFPCDMMTARIRTEQADDESTTTTFTLTFDYTLKEGVSRAEAMCWQSHLQLLCNDMTSGAKEHFEDDE